MNPTCHISTRPDRWARAADGLDKVNRFFLLVMLLALLTGAQKGYAMEANTALGLVQAWGRDSRDMKFIGHMEVDSRGGFLTQASGAFFRFEPDKKRLLVSGLVGYNITIHSKHPDTWQDLVRAGQRERPTLGEGQFELYPKQLFHLEPDVILLTKSYSAEAVDPKKFATEVRWLLSAANYWLMKRYSDVAEKPEADLVGEAPGIIARWPKRPW